MKTFKSHTCSILKNSLAKYMSKVNNIGSLHTKSKMNISNNLLQVNSCNYFSRNTINGRSHYNKLIKNSNFGFSNKNDSSFINQVINNPDNLFKLDLDNKNFKNLNEHYSYLFSEYGFFKYRTIVEVEWLKSLITNFSKEEIIIKTRDEYIPKLNKIIDDFNNDSFFRMKEIEKTTNHDVKAVEYYIKEQLSIMKFPNEYYELTHFCCTSEDINNTAQGLMLKEFFNLTYILIFNVMINSFRKQALLNKNSAMMSRTHGQSASPTTFGKELANFAYRANELGYKMKTLELKAKINGAVGNFNAHFYVDSNFDWKNHAKVFIENLGLEFNPYSTQIENHDSICEIMNYMISINTVLVDFCRDMYAYNYLNYFNNKDFNKNDRNIFSSTEGELLLSNSLLKGFVTKLPISRFQRDLSDSTTMRNFGVAFNHSLKAMINITEILDKLDVNASYLKEELNDHYELLAEPVQTILRVHKFKDPYELLKKHTRGKKFTKETYEKFISELDCSKSLKEELLKLTPNNYLGNAVEMSESLQDYLK